MSTKRKHTSRNMQMKTSTHTDICMKEVCGKAVGQEGISEGDKYKISLK